MIVDKLENISIYKNIPIDAINFIKNLHVGIECGRYELSNGIYANVEKYHTKLLENARFEAHCAYVDIQILLSGSEYIYVTDKSSLTVSVPYDKNRDICFYSDSLNETFSETLDSTNFLVLFPHEAHAPQVSIQERSNEVLKAVIKIPMKLFL